MKRSQRTKTFFVKSSLKEKTLLGCPRRVEIIKKLSSMRTLSYYRHTLSETPHGSCSCVKVKFRVG